MKIPTLARLFALSLLVPSWAANAQGVTDTEVLIGEVNPYTGPPALLGIAHASGVKMAFAEANEQGVNGRKLRLITEDDGYVTTRTLQAVRKLIDVDKVFAMMGISGAGQSVPALPILEKAGLPSIISVAPTSPQFEPPIKNVFVLGQVYNEGIRELTLYLADKFPGKKWAIVTQDDDYGLLVTEGFEAAKKAKNINVVFSANYKRGQTDFASEMLRLKESGAEVFLAGGIISENVAMLKELEKLGHKPVVGIFWPGRIEVVLKLAGPASDGLYAVDYVAPLAGAAGQAFMAKAKALLSEGELKGVNRYTEVGYAAGRVMVEAIRRCGKNVTKECVVGELEKTNNLDTGIMAPISFGAGKRFSNQKVQIMQADYGTLSYKPAP